jgi:malonate-semialdehyde dehydrogenase (acetylating)/methylmalonate-semialdehyde dehydrogenase
MAVSVVVAVGEVGDRLVDAIKKRLPKLKIGPGLEPENEMGPLVTREHRDRVASYIDSGREQGATVVADGRELDVDGDGFFLGVSLLDKVTPEMDAYRDEIFGPVLSVVRAKDYEEALRLPNEHEYGNGVAIFTRDGDTARDFTNRVQVGMVGVNFAIPVPLAYHSFGGWKRSGFGDLNQHGPDSVRFYTKTKTVTARWPSGTKEGAEFVIPTMR